MYMAVGNTYRNPSGACCPAPFTDCTASNSTFRTASYSLLAILFSLHCLYQRIYHVVELICIDRLITCYRCICIAAAAVASYAVGNAAVVVLVVSR